MSRTITHHSTAFTLIELLVVISIIALLVAILLPALSAARTTAKLTQAVSNSRQVMISLHTYANDNDSSLPWSSFYDVDDDPVTDEGRDGPFSTTKLWNGKYVQDWHVFWSPDHLAGGCREHPIHFDKPIFRWSGFAALEWGAMPNSGIRNWDTGAGPLHPRRLDESGGNDPSIGRLSETMVVIDMSNPFWFSPHNRRWSGNWNMTPGGGKLFTYDGNVARGYLDGHAEGGASSILGYTATGQRTGEWDSTIDNYASDPRAYKAPWFMRRNDFWNVRF